MQVNYWHCRISRDVSCPFGFTAFLGMLISFYIFARASINLKKNKDIFSQMDADTQSFACTRRVTTRALQPMGNHAAGKERGQRYPLCRVPLREEEAIGLLM